MNTQSDGFIFSVEQDADLKLSSDRSRKAVLEKKNVLESINEHDDRSLRRPADLTRNRFGCGVAQNWDQ